LAAGHWSVVRTGLEPKRVRRLSSEASEDLTQQGLSFPLRATLPSRTARDQCNIIRSRSDLLSLHYPHIHFGRIRPSSERPREARTRYPSATSYRYLLFGARRIPRENDTSQFISTLHTLQKREDGVVNGCECVDRPPTTPQ